MFLSRQQVAIVLVGMRMAGLLKLIVNVCFQLESVRRSGLIGRGVSLGVGFEVPKGGAIPSQLCLPLA